MGGASLARLSPRQEKAVTSHYDVTIIGSGAGGGTLVRHLAPSGKKILFRERAGWITREPEN
jgi:choline dehydrogenase-like flavoprotein